MSKFYDKHGSGNDGSLSAFIDNEATHADIEALLATDIRVLADKMDHYQQIHQAIQPDYEGLIEDSGSFLEQMHRKLDEGKQDTNVVEFPTQNTQLTKPQKLEHVQLPTMHDDVGRSKRSFFSGVAVAASVAFAVVLGGNLFFEADRSSSTASFATVSLPQQSSVEPLNALNAEEALQNNKRLQNYLRQHAQQASMTVGQGMIPMAKVVGFPQGNSQ